MVKMLKVKVLKQGSVRKKHHTQIRHTDRTRVEKRDVRENTNATCQNHLPVIVSDSMG